MLGNIAWGAQRRVRFAFGIRTIKGVSHGRGAYRGHYRHILKLRVTAGICLLLATVGCTTPGPVSQAYPVYLPSPAAAPVAPVAPAPQSGIWYVFFGQDETCHAMAVVTPDLSTPTDFYRWAEAEGLQPVMKDIRNRAGDLMAVTVKTNNSPRTVMIFPDWTLCDAFGKIYKRRQSDQGGDSLASGRAL